MKNSKKPINQSTWQLYCQYNVPYRGYVEGLGYVDSMDKSYVMLPPWVPAQTIDSVDFHPGISSIPTLDMSPGQVVRSHSNLSNLLCQEMVSFDGRIYKVDLGNGNYLEVDRNINFSAVVTVGKQDQPDAYVQLEISHDIEGGRQQYKYEYRLDDLPMIYSDNDNIYQLYFPSVEDETDLSYALNVTNYGRNQKNINNHVIEMPDPEVKLVRDGGLLKDVGNVSGYAIGGASTAVSFQEFYLHQEYKGIIDDLVEGEGLRHDTHTNSRFKNLKNAAKNRFEIGMDPLEKDLWKMAKEQPRGGGVAHGTYGTYTKLSRGLSWAGLGVSVFNGAMYLYEGEYTTGQSVRVAADIIFSAIAFIPVYGGIISGAYFLITTLYDICDNVVLSKNDYEDSMSKFAIHEESSGVINFVIERNENYSGMRQDNTRVKMIDERILELKSQEIKDRMPYMKIP
ncbi:MAG: hypothetical protein VZQ98_04785 [Bacteroidales bacterium]|nr:hypothetical protein [Bacteroidales bacterium]